MFVNDHLLRSRFLHLRLALNRKIIFQSLVHIIVTEQSSVAYAKYVNFLLDLAAVEKVTAMILDCDLSPSRFFICMSSMLKENSSSRKTQSFLVL